MFLVIVVSLFTTMIVGQTAKIDSKNIVFIDSIFIPPAKPFNPKEVFKSFFSDTLEKAISRFWHEVSFSKMIEKADETPELPGFTLYIYKIRSDSAMTHQEVLSEIGNKFMTEDEIYQAWKYFFERKQNLLAILSSTNTFYAKLKDGSTLAPRIFLYTEGIGGWYLYAYPLNYGFCDYGSLVFSKK